jgi:murein DD-endopeptidase MepM/ murein hydrolase activator NlpD
MEEFAFDLVRLGPDHLTHRGSGLRFADYYAYGQPVFAAAEGRVTSVVADQGENPRAMRQADESLDAYFKRLGEEQQQRLTQGRASIIGNSVVIEHGNGEFSFYAHLKPGSIRVRAGEQVARGQLLGQVGSSGNSTEPHLHFQVCDGPDPLLCAGIPVQFEPVANPLGDPPRAPQTGDFLSRPTQLK